MLEGPWIGWGATRCWLSTARRARAIPKQHACLEAYMDRTLDGDWRADAAHQRSASHDRLRDVARGGGLKILGLQEGAGEEEIRSAHRPTDDAESSR